MEGQRPRRAWDDSQQIETDRERGKERKAEMEWQEMNEKVKQEKEEIKTLERDIGRLKEVEQESSFFYYLFYVTFI